MRKICQNNHASIHPSNLSLPMMSRTCACPYHNQDTKCHASSIGDLQTLVVVHMRHSMVSLSLSLLNEKILFEYTIVPLCLECATTQI